MIGHIDIMYQKLNFPGCLYTSLIYKEEYPDILDCEIQTLGYLTLLERYVYPLNARYMKVNVGMTLDYPISGEVDIIIGRAIPLFFEDGRMIPKKDIYYRIERRVHFKAEEYRTAFVKGIFFRVYFRPDDIQPPVDHPLLDLDLLQKIIDVYPSEKEC